MQDELARPVKAAQIEVQSLTATELGAFTYRSIPTWLGWRPEGVRARVETNHEGLAVLEGLHPGSVLVSASVSGRA